MRLEIASKFALSCRITRSYDQAGSSSNELSFFDRKPLLLISGVIAVSPVPYKDYAVLRELSDSSSNALPVMIEYTRKPDGAWGCDDFIRDTTAPPRRPLVDTVARCKHLIEHLLEVVMIWNHYAEEVGLPVWLNADKVIARLRNKDFTGYQSFLDRFDNDYRSKRGEISEQAICVVIDMIVRVWNNPAQDGLLIGATQARKTLPSLALLWLGPALFLLTGRKHLPIYLTISDLSQVTVARRALHDFTAWYGDLEMGGKTDLCKLTDHPHAPLFFQNKTLNNYVDEVIGGYATDRLPSATQVPIGQDDVVQRRVHGHKVNHIAELCLRAARQGVEARLLIDEIQYGASDSKARTKTGGHGRAVLRQIIEAAQGAIGYRIPLIGISATAPDLRDISDGVGPHFWRVQLGLTSKYIGINLYGGAPIDPSRIVRTPDCVDFESFGAQADIALLAQGQFDVRVWHWYYNHGSATKKQRTLRFRRWCQETGYSASHKQYARDFSDALRDAILHIGGLIADQAGGICLRAYNNNKMTDFLIADMALDPDTIEVLKYYRHDDDDRTCAMDDVETFLLKQRRRRDLPFVMFVTNKARAANAFPNDVRYFFEAPPQTTSQNAVVQGLFGRSTGEKDLTTVIMSRFNVREIRKYANGEDTDLPASPHTQRAAGVRKNPTTILPIRLGLLDTTTGLPDAVVAAYFQWLTGYIGQWVEQDTVKLKVKSAAAVKGKPRTVRAGPVLSQALAMLDHLERPEVQKTRYPQYEPGMRIARIDDTVTAMKSKAHAGIVKRCYYRDPDNAGWTEFAFRENRNPRAGAGARGRHDGDIGRDGRRDRETPEMRLEPVIYMEKFDARTGQVIDDKHLVDARGEKVANPKRRPGRWRPHMITFPLCHPINEIAVMRKQFPSETSPFWDHNMSEDDRNEVRAMKAARGKKTGHRGGQV